MSEVTTAEQPRPGGSLAAALARVAADFRLVLDVIAADPQRDSPVLGAEEEINKAVEARSLYAAPFPMDATRDGALAAARLLARAQLLTSVCICVHPSTSPLAAQG